MGPPCWIYGCAPSSFEAYAAKLVTRADSIIAALAPTDFDAGIAALRAHGARNPDVAVFVFRRPGAH